jgi:hypothetical protein
VSGDTGYGPHLADIGLRFGGFDLVVLDTGQYDERWPYIHMTPGAGFGTSVQGAIGIVVPFAPPSQRAGVLSVIFVVSYLAMGAPAVVAGYLVAHGGNISTTARELGATVMILAALALLGAVGNLRGRT